MSIETQKALVERRSVRRYTDEMPKEEQIQAILEAGLYAATGRDSQGVRFVVVENQEVIQNLERINARIMEKPDAHPFYGAPCLITIFADGERPTWLQDGSLAVGNMMLAAHNEGLGSCWINRAYETFEEEDGKALRQSWGLSDNWKGIAHLILGYVDGAYPKASPRQSDRVIYVK